MPPPPVAVYRSDDFLARVAFYQRFHVAAALTEALENRTPSEQRTLIGETLYPLVELLQPLFAPKITGMLLELPRPQIFRCIESPEVLKAKVNEAIDVLVDWYPQQMKLNGQEAKDIHDPLSRAAFTRRFSVAVLNEALENRTPSEQRILIGETLYPLVELVEPNFTAKITGMLLELDRTQIFKLIESPEAFKEKENIQYGTCEKCEEAKTGFETHDDCETYSLSDPRLWSGHPSTKPTQLGNSRISAKPHSEQSEHEKQTKYEIDKTKIEQRRSYSEFVYKRLQQRQFDLSLSALGRVYHFAEIFYFSLIFRFRNDVDSEEHSNSSHGVGNSRCSNEFLRFLNRKVPTVTPIKMKQEHVRSDAEGELQGWDEGMLIDPTHRTSELD
ncbi:hypothetical protein IGI04_012075 [Brassica rapa subsp. trilocularis]|uniref:PABC domain-containing protein n=1 Tax=Brassica rapa subsp. trilocularis TaxID=1813537 RepID=A0ABQ7N723_BRACM|nr:hypothetical protein IGI04_012075 [Brassica rapa subsp. trilocularis]